jgi:hypothetical protein
MGNRTELELHQLAVATDTRLAELYQKDFRLRTDIQWEAERIARMIHTHGHEREELARKIRFIETTVDTLEPQLSEWGQLQFADAVKRLKEKFEQRNAVAEERRPLDALYQQHQWSRFFLVTNTNGHIHKTMYCHTCFEDTRFQWLPNLSGLTEANAVQQEGEILCTACFPTAPVDWTRGVARRDLEARAARAAAKAEREAKKLAKALLPDGGVFRFKNERITTLHTAKAELKRELEWQKYYPNATHAFAPVEEIQRLIEAIAAKEGKTAQEVEVETKQKVNKQLKKDGYAGWEI